MAKGSSGAPIVESFIHRPVSGDLTSGGVEWSSTVTTSAADTDTPLDIITYEPRRRGKIDGKATGGILAIVLTVGLKSSAGTPNGKWKIQGRNKGGTWVDLFAISAAIALSTTELERTYSGYFPTVANFSSVPFDLRLVIQSDSGTNNAIGRIKNSSYVIGEFEA